MKVIYLIGCCLLSSLLACQYTQPNNETIPPTDTLSKPIVPVLDTLVEKQAINTLFQEFYRRLNTMCRTPDFEPEENEEGTAYIGIKQDVHQKRMKELHSTGLLDSSFLQHYNQLAETINKALRSGTMEWNVGDVAPFGQGANPWINAQDHPDAYWLTISTTVQTLTPSKAQLTWSWGNDMHYPAEAIKTSEGWKISRLAGFDTGYFIGDSEK
jgi:hypothetical protein